MKRRVFFFSPLVLLNLREATLDAITLREIGIKVLVYGRIIIKYMLFSNLKRLLKKL